MSSLLLPLLLPLLPKSSGVFWLLLQRGEAQQEANLYQFFAVSLNNLILSVNNENTQAHTARWGCEKGKPFVRWG
jgi:hypothetical protein